MKKVLKGISVLLAILLCVAVICGITAACIYKFNRPTVTVDFSQKTGEVTNGASGFLYGLAEPDIPTAEIADSINISTLSTKPIGGLQHPIGDLEQIADTFLRAGGENLIIYTQDMYDTWYYQFDSLELYHARVQETVTKMAALPYSDKITYCIYNEMDNGAWFGPFWEYGNRLKTYEAWKATYALVKSIDPNAKIGGPGYCGYNSDYIKEFLAYCKAENCLPDTMIWHELALDSLYFFSDHCNDFKAICKELNIPEIPICITEYGLMATNGIPGESVKWIERIESAKIEGCIAYWRLANNLSEVAADDVSPNSNWWAYRFYAELSGETVAFEAKDLFQSNVENYYIKRKTEELKSKGFTAIPTIDEDEGVIRILAGGSNRNSTIRLTNLDKTEAFRDAKRLYVTVDYVDYKGLEGVVTAPKIKFTQYVDVQNGTAKIRLDNILYTQCFNITVLPESDDFVGDEMTSDINAMHRYEAEDAALFGTAEATDQIAYAASEGMLVKMNSSEGSGAEFAVTVDSDGIYVFDLIYGNGANNIRDDKGIRSTVEMLLSVDGGEPQKILLPSTIKDDFTSCVSVEAELSAGKHTVRLTLPENKDFNETVSLDFLDVTKADEVPPETYIQPDADRSTAERTSFLTVVDTDGYYALRVLCPEVPTSLTVNGIDFGNVLSPVPGDACFETVVYLHRGVNYLDIPMGDAELVFFVKNSTDTTNQEVSYDPDAFVLTNGAQTVYPLAQSTADAQYLKDPYPYIGNIDSDLHATATVTYTAEKDGYYQLTFLYANNEEGGAHDYNVDLVERYVTVSVDGIKVTDAYFRNTYSWDTYKTKTVTVYLTKGTHTITLSNDGSYRFNGKTTYAPHIATLTVCPASVQAVTE